MLSIVTSNVLHEIVNYTSR